VPAHEKGAVAQTLTHQLQFVEQALMLMSELEPAHQVFMIGTTNHMDNIVNG
jgi:SpoVK/Ycf46/Vps4 family AAA+-type ATPase